jgi:hypothetical protein
MSTDLPIKVGTVIKTVKYMSGEPEIVEVKFLGKPHQKAGYQVEYEGRAFCAGYELFEGAMILAFTF